MMAKVRRKKSSQQPHNHHQISRLLRVWVVVLACIFTSIFLFQMDRFRSNTHSKPLLLRKKAAGVVVPRYLSPDLLLKEQQQQQLALKGQDSTEVEREKFTKNERDVVNDETKKKVEITISNLEDGGSASILVEIVPEWAPRGGRQFWTLIESGFYQQVRFFRVLPNFVAQFGIPANPTQSKGITKILDDPVVQSNTRGTLTFAMNGPNTRTNQLFFNLKDNKQLDNQGFAPIGYIVEGIDVLEKIVDKYREKPNQGRIVQNGNAYLQENFPDLSYISDIRIL